MNNTERCEPYWKKLLRKLADDMDIELYPEEYISAQKMEYVLTETILKIETLKQQKNGYWIRGFGNTSCECSKCGGNGDSQYKYCPWCGNRKGV